MLRQSYSLIFVKCYQSQVPSPRKLREGVNKQVFYGQADRKGPPPYGQFFVNFFGVCLTLDYDFMCTETYFHKKKSHFYPTTYCFLLLCH